jgi:hypothetical protein
MMQPMVANNGATSGREAEVFALRIYVSWEETGLVDHCYLG